MLPRKHVGPAEQKAGAAELQLYLETLVDVRCSLIEGGAGRAALLVNVHTRYLKLHARNQLVDTHTVELRLRSSGPSLCRDELGLKFPLHTCSPWLLLETQELECAVETKFSFWLLLMIC